MNNLNVFSKVIHTTIKAFPKFSPQLRNYAPSPPKKFYRKTGILSSDGRYEITLDQKKLKTPNLNPFIVDSEPLALAVAAEWDAQKDIIQQSSMHLSALCSTVIDNPNKVNKYDMVQYITNFLETDTVLFQEDPENEASKGLYKFQEQEWDPIIKWFNERYNVNIEKCRDILGPTINSDTKATIEKHLLSYNFAAVNGFVFAVDTLKSIVLTLACVDRFVTPEKAVYLSRLEEEFQLGHWGRVEWAHDFNQQELQARLAAAVLFIHFNTSATFYKKKHRSSN